MKNTFKFLAGAFIAGALLALVVPFGGPSKATAAAGGIGTPSTLWSTENNVAAQQVTNKILNYNVASQMSNQIAYIDCTGGKELFIQFRFRYTTATIPATNTVLTFSSAAENNVRGSTNRQQIITMACAGNTTDGWYLTYTTNFSVLGRPYVYLDSVLALAPLTNASVKYFVK